LYDDDDDDYDEGDDDGDCDGTYLLQHTPDQCRIIGNCPGKYSGVFCGSCVALAPQTASTHARFI